MGIILVLITITSELHPAPTVIRSPVLGPVTREQVAVDQNGDLFLLDEAEKKVYCVDWQGVIRHSFGSQGQGPGAFERPTSLAVIGDRVYVDEPIRGTSVFSTGGVFIERVSPMGAEWSFCPTLKVADGWLNFVQSANPGELGETRLLWRSNQDAEHVLVRSWSVDIESDQTVIDGHSRRSGYNPAQTRWYGVRSSTWRYYFIIVPGPNAKLAVFDCDSKSIRQFPLEHPRIKFNDAWGEATIKRKSQGTAIEVQLAAPDFFPIVKMVYPLPGDDVAVELWTASPDRIRRFAFYDHGGSRVKEENIALEYRPDLLDRLVFGPDDTVWVLAMDSDEDNLIVGCHPSMVDQVAQEYAWEAPNERIFWTLQ